MDRIFKLNQIEVKPGERCNTSIPFAKSPDGADMNIPLIIINGVESGPRLLVIAAEHGDELEGTLAIINVVNELNPIKLKGTFIGIPVLNLPGYLHKTSLTCSGTSENPIDMKNLTGILPGRSDGTITERMADAVCTRLLPHVDYILNLHSGSARGTSIRMAGFVPSEDKEYRMKTVKLAKLFPMEIIWRMPPWAKLFNICEKRGVPLVICEVTGRGMCEDEDVELYVIGIKNVMKHLRMIEGKLERTPKKRKYIDSETYIYASAGGLFHAEVKTGDVVSRGHILGRTFDVYGNATEKFEAPFDCIVTGVRTRPVVWAGQDVCLVSSFIPDPSKQLVLTRAYHR